jgi:ADP-heptose:LPS heptosyltransferase
VLRPGALGDTLLTVPAVRALRTIWPDAELTLAAHGAAARLLAGCGEVDRGLSFEDPRLAWLWAPAPGPDAQGPAFATPRAPFSPRPDAVVGWLTDPERRLHRRLVARGVSHLLLAPSRSATADCHVAHYLWGSLSPLAAHLPTFDAHALRLPDAGATRPAETGDRAPPGQQEDAVLLHPGSGSARKNWPASSFAAVADNLLARGVAVRLVVGEADVDAAARFEQALGPPVPRLTELSLGELARVLAGCRAYLGNDSGVTHLAGLVGAPTFALFGATDPRQWRPLGPRVTVLPFDTMPSAAAALLVGV